MRPRCPRRVRGPGGRRRPPWHGSGRASDRRARILGLPNRWTIALALSLISVGVELLLHALGVFHWYYWWWNVASLPVIVVFGYLTFYVVAFSVYDAGRRSAQLAAVGSLAALDLGAGLIFGPLLGWI